MCQKRIFYPLLSMLLLTIACLSLSAPSVDIPATQTPVRAESLPPADPGPTETVIPAETLPSPSPSSTSQPTQPETPVPLTPTLSTPVTSFQSPRLSPDQPVRLKELLMLGGGAGWGFEFRGILLHTLDGGLTWRDATPPQNGKDSFGFVAPIGFFAFDSNLAWAALNTGGGITFLHTTDSGNNWIVDQSVKPGELDLGVCGPLTIGLSVIHQLYFIDSRHGWLTATAQAQEWGYAVSLLFATQDGGQTWTLRNFSTRDCSKGAMPDGLRSVYFRDPERGWGGFFPEKWSYFPHNQQRYVGGWEIYQTTDGGGSWQAVQLPAPPGFLEQANLNGKDNAACGIQEIMPLAPDILALDMSCFLYGASSGEQNFLYLTTNGGQSWEGQRATGNENFFAGVNDGHQLTGWRLEGSPDQALNNLQTSTDGGRTWTTIKRVAWQYASFDFISQREGWAIVTANGVDALVHTTDGGETWELIRPKTGR